MTQEGIVSYLDRKTVPSGYKLSYGKYEQGGMDVVQLRVIGRGLMMHSFITDRASESVIDYIIEQMIKELDDVNKARDSKWFAFKRWVKKLIN